MLKKYIVKLTAENDPIVQQVHETRERLAAAFDFDVARIFADMRL